MNKMETKSCFHFKNFITKKMTKDIILMISIIIHNYSQKKLRGGNFEKKR